MKTIFSYKIDNKFIHPVCNEPLIFFNQSYWGSNNEALEYYKTFVVTHVSYLFNVYMRHTDDIDFIKNSLPRYLDYNKRICLHTRNSSGLQPIDILRDYLGFLAEIGFTDGSNEGIHLQFTLFSALSIMTNFRGVEYSSCYKLIKPLIEKVLDTGLKENFLHLHLWGIFKPRDDFYLDIIDSLEKRGEGTFLLRCSIITFLTGKETNKNICRKKEIKESIYKLVLTNVSLFLVSVGITERLFNILKEDNTVLGCIKSFYENPYFSEDLDLRLECGSILMHNTHMLRSLMKKTNLLEFDISKFNTTVVSYIDSFSIMRPEIVTPIYTFNKNCFDFYLFLDDLLKSTGDFKKLPYSYGDFEGVVYYINSITSSIHVYNGKLFEHILLDFHSVISSICNYVLSTEVHSNHVVLSLFDNIAREHREYIYRLKSTCGQHGVLNKSFSGEDDFYGLRSMTLYSAVSFERLTRLYLKTVGKDIYKSESNEFASLSTSLKRLLKFITLEEENIPSIPDRGRILIKYGEDLIDFLHLILCGRNISKKDGVIGLRDLMCHGIDEFISQDFEEKSNYLVSTFLYTPKIIITTFSLGLFDIYLRFLSDFTSYFSESGLFHFNVEK